MQYVGLERQMINCKAAVLMLEKVKVARDCHV